MFDTLLESRHMPFGLPRWGLAVALGLHAAVVAAVLRPPAPPPEQPVWIGTDFPSSPEPVGPTRSDPTGPVLPHPIEIRLPSVLSPEPIPGVPVIAVPSVGRPAMPEGSPAGPWEEMGTDVLPARLVQDPPVLLTAPVPPYPERMREAGVAGLVVVQVVVDTTGRPELATLRVVQSTDVGFENAAVTTIRGALFRPGRVWGRAVRVLVQVPVAFRLRP